MTSVEFVYEETCPFIGATRSRLIAAFQKAEMRPHWIEWSVNDPDAPAYVRAYGSPTILIDGQDIANVPTGEAGNCCRIYSNESKMQGVPPLEMIFDALKNRMDALPQAKKGHQGFPLKAAMLPSIMIVLLPKLTCPACWAAYAGFLSAVGVGFVNYTPYLMPLTALFLAISVFAMAYRAKMRRGYGPFFLGLAATIIVLIGKFEYESDTTMWLGLVVLVAASVWNTWPVKSGEPIKGCGLCTGADRVSADNWVKL